jgi:hypothetical protein
VQSVRHAGIPGTCQRSNPAYKTHDASSQPHLAPETSTTLAEGGDRLVQLAGDARDGALVDAAQSECLHQEVWVQLERELAQLGQHCYCRSAIRWLIREF